MLMTNCPTQEELERFQSGESSEADDRRIQSHIDQCKQCASRLQQVGDRFNDLIRHLKGLDFSSEFMDENVLAHGQDPADGQDDEDAEPRRSSARLLPPEDVIPGYKILREIHHGGQGVVYQALQKSTKRKVAIKVLLDGPFATSTSRKRFEREIELVASLNHPNIVSVFDSGVTESGRQYCVMDYVRGLPLDAYVEQTKLSLDAALELFMKLCLAVNYAHQKGVIHRDLKPSNILVDDGGEPRVLDFGLARQMVNREQTLLSLTGQVVGTLPYLSPEQAEGNPEKIDIRSDVYALGVILYEMLTGHYPYPVDGQLADVLNHITNTPATAPGKAWQSQSGIKAYSAEGLVVERCPIDEEVHTIVMRALSKERERRYQTARELAQDIRYYLADEPIEAKRDSNWYILRKRVQRYKLGVAVGTIFTGVVVVALIVTASLWRAADRARQKAEIEANKARQTVAFTNDILAGVDPETARGMDTRLVHMLLDRAAERVRTVLSEQPEVAASVYSTIGRTYTALGAYPEAERFLIEAVGLYRRELGNENAETLEAKGSLANAYSAAGKYEKAEVLFQETLDVAKRVLGAEHPDTLNLMNNLASLYLNAGRYQESEKLLTLALDARKRINGEEHVQTLNLMHNLAGLYEATARYDEAEALLRKTLDIRRRVQGDDHPDTLDSMGNLAKLLDEEGRAREAEPMLAEALKAHRRIYGPKHPATLKIMNNLANVWVELDRTAEAEQLCRETLEAMKRVFGEDHPETLKLMNNLANRYFNTGRFDLADPLYQEALDTRRRVLGEDHPSTLFSLSNLARLYTNEGRFKEAEPMLKMALAAQEKVLGETHPDTLLTKGNLADLYSSTRDYAKAEIIHREVLEARSKVLGPDHPNTLVTMNNLGNTLCALGKLDEAKAMFEDALQRRRRVSGEDHIETMRIESNLILVLRRSGDEQAALRIQKRLLARQLARAHEETADADMLNEVAWTLLTTEPADLRDPKSALDLALRSNNLTSFENAGYLDTLALAYFMTGDSSKAVEYEKKAVSLLPAGSSPLRDELEANLARFQAPPGDKSTSQNAE